MLLVSPRELPFPGCRTDPTSPEGPLPEGSPPGGKGPAFVLRQGLLLHPGKRDPRWGEGALPPKMGPVGGVGIARRRAREGLGGRAGKVVRVASRLL